MTTPAPAVDQKVQSAPAPVPVPYADLSPADAELVSRLMDDLFSPPKEQFNTVLAAMLDLVRIDTKGGGLDTRDHAGFVNDWAKFEREHIRHAEEVADDVFKTKAGEWEAKARWLRDIMQKQENEKNSASPATITIEEAKTKLAEKEPPPQRPSGFDTVRVEITQARSKLYHRLSTLMAVMRGANGKRAAVVYMAYRYNFLRMREAAQLLAARDSAEVFARALTKDEEPDKCRAVTAAGARCQNKARAKDGVGCCHLEGHYQQGVARRGGMVPEPIVLLYSLWFAEDVPLLQKQLQGLVLSTKMDEAVASGLFNQELYDTAVKTQFPASDTNNKK